MRLIAVLLSLMLSLPAIARPLDAPETAALEKSVTGFLRAIERKDVPVIVSTIPPRIKNLIAGMSGIEASKLDQTLTEQTRDIMKTARFSDMSVTLDGIEASDATLADGTRVVWALVPTRFTMDVAGRKSRVEQSTLALREGRDKWFMIRIEGAPQQQMVALAYPFMKDVEIPPSRTAPLD